MLKSRIVLFLCATTVLYGCSSSRRTGFESDLRINTTTKTITHPETIGIRLPVYSLRQTVVDSTSTLQTPVAKSEARINPDGSLSHSLTTTDTVLNVPVTGTTVSTERISYGKRESVCDNSRKLSLWELLQLIIVGAVVVALIKKCR